MPIIQRRETEVKNALPKGAEKERWWDRWILQGLGSGHPAPEPTFSYRRAPLDWKNYAFALVVLAACNGLAWACYGLLDLTNILMIYLIGILAVVSVSGKGPSTLTCILGVLSFDFFMVPPRFAFAHSDTQYLITLGVVLLFTLAISELMARVRRQTETLRFRESRTSALLALSRRLSDLQEREALTRAAVEHIAQIFDSRAAILMPDEKQTLELRAGEAPHFAVNPSEQRAAGKVFQQGNMAGPGMEDFPGLQTFYLPLVVSGDPVGVLAVQPKNPDRPLAQEQQHLLQALANQIGASLQNLQLSEEGQRARVQAETEHLRSALLSSVSHDLRTPLAVITGSASSLLDPEDHLSPEARRELAQDIYSQSERLNRLLSNLLEMTRLSAGKVELKKEFQPLEEVVGAALSRLEKKLEGREMGTDLPEDLPMVPLDSLPMEQVFINLLENALKYTPEDSPIGISAHVRGKFMKVTVSDSGPGLKKGDEERIFEKFYRGEAALSQGGVGLGLAICRAVVEAHGGRIWAENRPEGGASFCFTLPLAQEPVPGSAA